MPKINFSDIKGVFSNGDPDNTDLSLVKSLENFRPMNGKLVKTHGASDTEDFAELHSDMHDYSINNLVVFTSDFLSGTNHRTLVVKCNHLTNGVKLDFSKGI